LDNKVLDVTLLNILQIYQYQANVI